MKLQKKQQALHSALCFWVAVIVFFLPHIASAAAADDLQKQIDAKNQEILQIQKELQQYTDQLSKTSEAAKTLNAKIVSINKDIANLRKQISLTNSKVQQKQLEIQQLNLFIQQKQQDIQQRQAAMGAIVQVFAERQEANILEVLVQYNSLSDFFSYLEQNKNFQKELQANLAELRDLKAGLETDKVSAEQKKTELTHFQNTLSDKKLIAENEQKDKQVLLAQTKDQEQQYQQLVQDTTNKYQSVLRDIEELEAQLRKNIDPASLPKPQGGILEWPVYGTITQGYGTTPFSVSSHFYLFHNGIDIRASVGTEVDAADKGKVVAIGNSDLYCPRGAYGKFIVIDHGNNLITLYAHLSLQKVVQGQDVARGDLIGYTGTTGNTTGPHLHFTVYDANTFELRQSKVCGILPYGGSVNPLDYLAR